MVWGKVSYFLVSKLFGCGIRRCILLRIEAVGSLMTVAHLYTFVNCEKIRPLPIE